MANGIVSISGSGSSCKLLSASTFDTKKRSKSSDKISDDKIKRWVRSSSQEYDEVPPVVGSGILSRCPSNGGTSEAAEVAASIAMQTLRKHYGDAINTTGSDMEMMKNSEYLNQMNPNSSLHKQGSNRMSLPVQSSNFDHVHPGAIGASPRKSESPSPPPPPPHRNVPSPSKVIGQFIDIVITY